MAGMEGGAECQEIVHRGCAVWCRGVHGAVHNRNAMEEGTEKELSWNAMVVGDTKQNCHGWVWSWHGTGMLFRACRTGMPCRV